MEVVDILIKLDLKSQKIHPKPMSISRHTQRQLIQIPTLKLHVIKQFNHDLPAFLQSGLILLIMLQLLDILCMVLVQFKSLF